MKTIFLTVICFIILSSNILKAQTVVYYVDAAKADNTGNGLSWATAKKDFQVAIDAASGATGTTKQVWVKKGTYQLASNTVYNMRQNVAMYGGFAGTETLLGQRNPVTNTTTLRGNGMGVIYSFDAGITASTILDGFTITNGSSAGIYIGNNSTCIVSNCFITNNNSNSSGGGIFMANSSPTIINCFIMNNTANNDGGGIQLNSGCSPTIINCVFVGNITTNGFGGGINSSGSTPTLINCTFNANKAIKANVGRGGAIASQTPSNTTIKNSIIWGNTASASNNNLYGIVTVTYSTVEGGITGTGNSAIDPVFNKPTDPLGPDGIAATADDGLKLTNCSPALDMGNNSLIPAGITTDITGAARIQNTIVEVGAYEGALGGSKPIFVDVARPDNSGDGLSWATAKRDVQAGIDATASELCANKQVWVKAGSYYPTDYPITGLTNLRDKTIYVKDGIQLYGGFDGTETTLLQRNSRTNITILSGDIGIANDSTDNCFHVVIMGANATIDGFTIQKGTANVASGNIIIGSYTLERNRGGGVRTMGDNNSIKNNYVLKNYAASGAGIYLNGIGQNVEANFIANNNSANGGGTFINTGNNSIVNNVYYKNNAQTKGGGLYILQSINATVVNNTFYANNADVTAGGLCLDNANAGNISNNIFWKNTKAGNATLSGADFNNGPSSTLAYRNNLLQLAAINYTNDNSAFGLGTAAVNNIFAQDPIFQNEANINGADNLPMTSDDGLKLTMCSPATNTGNNSFIPSFVTTDITGNTRFAASIVDMGAYEGNSGLGTKTVFVDAARADNTGDGFSWATAKKDLQVGIDLSATDACANKQVWVRQGTYIPNGNFTMKPNVSIFGGFAGTETLLSQRNWKTNTTILNNFGNPSYLFSITGNTITNTSILNGFTISNSSVSAIIINGSNPTIENCRFTGNTATNGAAIQITNCSPIITNCIFDNNTTTQDGGALYLIYGNATITNCLFVGNTTNNGFGGAIGGNSFSNPTITNCTFFDNAAPRPIAGYGGAMSSGTNSNFKINNSIVWGNNAGSAYTNLYGIFTINNSLIEGGYTGTGNIDANPNFVNSVNPMGTDGIFGTNDDGLRLSLCSPAVNAGNNIYLPTTLTQDLSGISRIQFTNIDIGAYENNSVNMNTGGLVNAQASCISSQFGIINYFDQCNGLIAAINSNGVSPIIGSTTAKIWIETTQPTQFVKRHYEITPATNATTATGNVTLYFTDAEFAAFNNQTPAPVALLPLSTDAIATQNARKANLLIEKIGGVSSDNSGMPNTYTGTITTIDPADADIIWNTTLSRWEVSIDVTGFSGFFVKTISGILPLKWLNVSANLNTEKKAVVQWQVQENDVANYEIEKSTNGINFSSIGNLISKGNGSNYYQFTETLTLQDLAYYRVKQIDRNGTISYSKIIKLNIYKSAQLTTYPNPVKNNLTISDAKVGSIILLSDMSGKILQQINVQQTAFTIDMSKYINGMYILKLYNGIVQKIIKE
ncbi:MAG: right-handed parallel beta-helix repeat-containing protein [Bacteroidetes bacterium]|nr:right-handed parallel beta-helix repeat-containing protein [Bacteroidota bacterium]